MNIKQRITAVFLAFFVLVLITQGAFFWAVESEFENAVEEGATAIGGQTLQGLLNTVERETTFHRAIALQFADSPLLQASNQRFATASDTDALLTGQDAEWRRGNATLRAAVTDNSLSDSLTEWMQAIEASRGSPGISEAFITNRYGGLVAAYGTPTDYNQRDEVWWGAARENNTFIDDAGYDRSAGTFGLTIAVTLVEDGDVTGVLKVVLDAEDFGRILRQATNRSQTIERVYVVNATDHILWADDPERMGTRLQPGGDLPPEGVFRAPSPVSGRSTVWNVAVDREREHRLGQDFRLVTVFNPESITATEERMEQNVIVTLLLMLLLGIVMIAGGRYYLYRPLQHLRETLDEVSRGNMAASIDTALLERDDDIGGLARSFDRIMASMRLAAKRSGVHTDTELHDAETRRAHLEATLDATENGILVVDMDRNIVRYNKQFREMWNVDEDVLDAGDDIAALETILDELEDSDAFLEKIQYLYEHPREESHDTVRFKDGRVFERYSRPQLLNGEVIGRVWSFHDVTDTGDASGSDTD